MTDARLVLTSCADRKSAETLARTLVEDRLAACVNLVPGVRSIYRWQGAVEEADEVLLVIKTTRAAYARLAARVTALHDYEVPELLAIDAAEGAAAYLGWLGESTVA